MMTYHYHASPARAQGWQSHIYERLAREAIAGRGLIGGLRVEPELGTPVRGGLPATIARGTADGWALSGTKIYSTGSTGLDWFSVWAKTDEDNPRVGNFLVRSDSLGITIEPVWDQLGMRATVSHAVHLADTPTPFDHAVDICRPEQRAAGAGDPSLAIWNALSISTIYDGVARATRDWLRAYLNDRMPTNLAASLATLPRVQEKFGGIQYYQISHDRQCDQGGGDRAGTDRQSGGSAGRIRWSGIIGTFCAAASTRHRAIQY